MCSEVNTLHVLILVRYKYEWFWGEARLLWLCKNVKMSIYLLSNTEKVQNHDYAK